MSLLSPFHVFSSSQKLSTLLMSVKFSLMSSFKNHTKQSHLDFPSDVNLYLFLALCATTLLLLFWSFLLTASCLETTLSSQLFGRMRVMGLRFAVSAGRDGPSAGCVAAAVPSATGRPSETSTRHLSALLWRSPRLLLQCVLFFPQEPPQVTGRDSRRASCLPGAAAQDARGFTSLGSSLPLREMA